MNFLTEHAGMIVFLAFFAMFLGIAVWSYLPRNKRRLQSYANIPLEDDHGEA